jgi:hypothetical protein
MRDRQPVRFPDSADDTEVITKSAMYNSFLAGRGHI